jgi:hypothetical protein
LTLFFYRRSILVARPICAYAKNYQEKVNRFSRLNRRESFLNMLRLVSIIARRGAASR